MHEITPMGDAVAKTYRIRIALPDDTPLHVGMSVEANVVTREKAERPAGAGRCRAGHAQCSSSRAVACGLRQVEIGIRGARSVEILSGLEEGERVVAQPPESLRDGQRVRAVERRREAP